MTENATIPLPGGGSANAAVALPPGNDKLAAVIVLHEWHGLNDEMKSRAEQFASLGLVAIAIDLFGGKIATDDAEAGKLAGEMKTAHSIEIIRAAVAWLKSHPRVNGKVAVSGFCLGGGQTLAAACNVEGLDAAVAFYGLPPEEWLDFGKTKTPILGHYAKVDAWIDPERVTKLAEKATAAGRSFEVHFYDGGHAFMRQSDPKVYHEASAKLAWDRTTAFLKKHL